MQRLRALLPVSLLTISACARPTIDIATARGIALEAQPGRVIDEELETEDGRQIYSFEIDPGDGSGNLREVHIDPASGSVLEIETETPSDEAREQDENKNP